MPACRLNARRRHNRPTKRTAQTPSSPIRGSTAYVSLFGEGLQEALIEARGYFEEMAQEEDATVETPWSSFDAPSRCTKAVWARADSAITGCPGHGYQLVLRFHWQARSKIPPSCRRRGAWGAAMLISARATAVLRACVASSPAGLVIHRDMIPTRTSRSARSAPTSHSWRAWAGQLQSSNTPSGRAHGTPPRRLAPARAPRPRPAHAR